MRKNGSRLISIKQYRLTDLFLFAIILVVFDLLAHYATTLFSNEITYGFTLTVPITLLVMIRWGWPSVFFAIGDGILLSLLNNINTWQSYLCYGIGNCFIMLLLLATRFIGKEKIRSKWYFSALFVLAGWLLENLGISVLMAICGYDIVEMLGVNFGLGLTGALSLALGIIIIILMRRFDGMFEDQKHYLIRLDEERKEKVRRDEFGDEPVQIDEESISILKRWDD